jgi:hypothetical protein
MLVRFPRRCAAVVLPVACLWVAGLLSTAAVAAGAAESNGKGIPGNADQAFAQLEQVLPTPTTVRAASGAPGAGYWQQRADYRIRAKLDEKLHRITASETITYTNRSPDTLSYVWLQLDQNLFKDGSLGRLSETAGTAGTRRDKAGPGDSATYNAMRRHQAFQDREYGYDLGS